MKHVCRQQRVVRMNLFMSTLVQLYVLHHSNKHLQKRAQSPITCTFCKVEHRSERSLFVTDPVPRKEFLKNHKSYFCCLKGTLMQIWKSANIFFFKWKYVEDFTFKIPFTLWDMRTWDMWKVCSQTLRNNRTCWKLA